MSYTSIAYSLYLGLSIGLTIWVARTLSRAGKVFLLEVFHGREPLADAVNHLLVVGFYLINLGYVCLALKYGSPANSVEQVFEALGPRMGKVLLVLGGMHFINLHIFHRMHGRVAERTPPVTPDAVIG